MITCPLICRSAHRRVKWRKRYRWLPAAMTRVGVIRGCFELECWYAPARGMFPWRSRWSDQPHRPPVVYPFVSVEVRKKTSAPTPGPEDGPKHLAPLATKSMISFPNMVAHCCVTRYDDGDPRQPGWFTLKTQGSAWVVVLKDPDSASQMQCLGNTLDDALALAELMAGSDDAPWEPDPWAKRQAGKKGGK